MTIEESQKRYTKQVNWAYSVSFVWLATMYFIVTCHIMRCVFAQSTFGCVELITNRWNTIFLAIVLAIVASTLLHIFLEFVRDRYITITQLTKRENKMKHAYLIMAHKNLSQLLRLLRVLDDDRNDIYLHLDIRFREADGFDFAGFLNHSEFRSISRRAMKWGSYDIVQAEFELLQTAVKYGPYRYYHLLSGQDFPIKSQSEIHCFFDGQDKDFIHFADPSDWDKVMRIRLNRFRKPIYQLYRLSEFLKLRTGLRPMIDFGFGSNWFSITDELARSFLAKQRWAYRYFGKCICPDELVLQTFVLTFGYENHLAAVIGAGDEIASKRYIDWSRGDGNHPYVWKTEDYQTLTGSNAMFARKFDSEIDENILGLIERNLL